MHLLVQRHFRAYHLLWCWSTNHRAPDPCSCGPIKELSVRFPRISSSGLDINALGHLLYTLFLRFLRTVSVVKARCSSRPISSFYRLLGTLPWTLSRRTLQCPIPFQSHTRDKPIVVCAVRERFPGALSFRTNTCSAPR